ncbi:MAG: SGNH/GDSL hydrolase family protein [Pseudomonadota bacterium]|nr:SGNH/GDSL hydrolase family protein [Pseudomonadota bacterium]
MPPVAGPLGLSARLLGLARAALAAASFFLAAEIALALVPRWVVRRHQGAPVPLGTSSPVVVLLGDSITAGYGVRRGGGWGSRLDDALVARGISGVYIENRAASATSIADQVEMVSGARRNATFLAMVGHNDFMRWKDLVNTHQPMFDGGLAERVLRWAPRLVRLGWYFVEDHSAEAALGAPDVTRFRAEMARLIAQVADRQGRLALLTYVVPGMPGLSGTPGAPDPKAMVVVHQAQQAINQLLRSLAWEADLPLIDLEATVPVSAEWTPTEFVDVIHPSAATHARIAAAVATDLVDKGLVDKGLVAP